MDSSDLLWDLNDQQLDLKLYTHGDGLDEHLFDESDLLYSLNRRNSLTLGQSTGDLRRNSLDNNSNASVAERRNSLRLIMERRNSLRNSLGLGLPSPMSSKPIAVDPSIFARGPALPQNHHPQFHPHANMSTAYTGTSTRPLQLYQQQQHMIAQQNAYLTPASTSMQSQEMTDTTASKSTNKRSRKKKDPSKPRIKVDHTYVDYSLVPDADIMRGIFLHGTPLQLCLRSNNVPAPMQMVDPPLPKKQGKACFPLKLMCILRHTEELAHIITWIQHGRSFIVRDQEAFRDEVMPRFFKPTLYKSFIRQLSLWGFKRITRGPDAGSYYHEFFLRGKPNLVTRMRCEKIKGTGVKLSPNPDMEPNFHLLAHKRPLFQLIPRRIPLPPSQGVYNVDAPFSHLQKEPKVVNAPRTDQRASNFSAGEVYHRDEAIMRRYSRKVSMQHDGPPIMYHTAPPSAAVLSNGAEHQPHMERAPQQRRTSVIQSVDQIVRRRSLISDQHKALMNSAPRRVSMDMNIAAIQQVRAQEAQQQQHYYSC